MVSIQFMGSDTEVFIVLFLHKMEQLILISLQIFAFQFFLSRRNDFML